MVLTEIRAALRSRTALVSNLHAESTDCYRLFHGATEGAPGCSLDRYGDLLLWQTFREPPPIPAGELLSQLREVVEDELGMSLQVHWNAGQKRQRAAAGLERPPAPPALAEGHACSELGLKYLIDVPKAGRDPGLYLDFRAARRWLANHSAGLEVVNHFAYTCGAGVAALAGGAASATNVDH